MIAEIANILCLNVLSLLQTSPPMTTCLNKLKKLYATVISINAASTEFWSFALYQKFLCVFYAINAAQQYEYQRFTNMIF